VTDQVESPDDTIVNGMPRRILQRLLIVRRNAGEEMPNSFHVPIGEGNHGPAGRHARSLRSGGFILTALAGRAGFDVGQTLRHQAGAMLGKLAVQVGHRIAARQRNRLLGQNRPGINLGHRAVQRHAGHAIVVVVGPEKRPGAPVPRQQCGMQVDCSPAGDREHLGRKDPSVGCQANQVRLEVTQPGKQCGIPPLGGEPVRAACAARRGCERSPADHAAGGQPQAEQGPAQA
jgi:hypothetical protein